MCARTLLRGCTWRLFYVLYHMCAHVSLFLQMLASDSLVPSAVMKLRASEECVTQKSVLLYYMYAHGGLFYVLASDYLVLSATMRLLASDAWLLYYT